MPFKSEKQRRYLHANHPDIAKRWEQEYSGGGIARMGYFTGSIPSSRGAIDWSEAFKDSSYLPKNFLEEELIVDDTLPGNLGDGIVAVDQVAEMTGNDKNSNSYNSGLNFNNMGSNFFNNFKETLPGRGITTAINFLTDNPFMSAITGGIGAMANRYNPLKEGSQNYNEDLQGQIEMLNETGMLGDQSGPYKITSGPLAGKNLVSAFGTNDYGRMLDKRIEYFRTRKNRTKEQTRKMHETIEAKRIADEARAKRAADAAAAAQVRSNIQRYGSGDRPNTGMNAPGGGRGQSPTGGDVQGTPFAHGGLANLWHRR